MIKLIFLLFLLLFAGKEVAASNDLQIAPATFRTLAVVAIELTEYRQEKSPGYRFYRAPWP